MLNKRLSVYDNSGKTADRYTIFDNMDIVYNSNHLQDCLGISDNPTHPQGFSQFTAGQKGKHLGKKILFSSLDEKLQTHIKERFGIC